MRAFVVLGLVFSIPSQEIGLGKGLRNDVFCVEWDVKPQLNQLIKASMRWWRGTVVERRSLTGELSLSCARPAADG